MDDKKLNHDDLIKQAEGYFVKLAKEGKLQTILDSMVKHNKHTLRNQLLIMQAMPSSTEMDTLENWNYGGRAVKMGSKGVKVLQPSFDRSTDEYKDADGQIKKRTVSKLVGFHINTMYDVTQTHVVTQTIADENAGFKSDAKLVAKNYETYKKVLEDSMKGYRFLYEPMENDRTGFVNNQEKIITIKSGMTPEETLKAIIEKISLALANTADRTNFKGLGTTEVKDIKNIESTCAAYVVNKWLGLDTKEFKFDFKKDDIDKGITDWNDARLNRFRNNIEQSRKITSSILRAVEPMLKEKLSEKTKTNKKELEVEAA